MRKHACMHAVCMHDALQGCVLLWGACAPCLSRHACMHAQITWRWQGFANPARADGLQLEHWVKCYKDPAGKVKPAEEGDYSFAKYNKKARLLQGPLEYGCSAVPP